MTENTFPYSYRFNAARIVDTDQTIVIEPDAPSRQMIADAYEVNKITALKGAFTLKPYRKAGVRAKGTIALTLNQTCVVTLEDFDSTLEIEVDRTFEPHSTRARKARDINEDGEIEIDLESLDPPDVIQDGILDLGAMICEELALVLDPFPRKPGAEFESGDPEETDLATEPEEKPSPFAALEALKDPKAN